VSGDALSELLRPGNPSSVPSVIEVPTSAPTVDPLLRDGGGATTQSGASQPFRFEKQLPFGPIAEKLADVPIDPEWTWEGFLVARAMTLLAGRPKVGKSTTGFGLIRAISRGDLFLELQTRQTGVLILSEEREQSLAEKMDHFGLDGSIELLMRHEVGPVSWAEVVEQAVARCHERELGVLVVDTWDKWTGLRGDAENRAGDVLEALEPLAMAAASGLAVLIVCHQRKSSGEYGEAVRGSNALTGSVDIVIEQERPSASMEAAPTTRILRAVSRFKATPGELVLRLIDAEFEVEEAPLVSKREANRERLLAALKNLGGATVGELVDETGAAKSTIGRHLKTLEKEGLVVHDDAAGVRGAAARWSLAPTSSTTDFPKGRV
jgi:DNA-binding transcriptional ArsR family regulator